MRSKKYKYRIRIKSDDTSGRDLLVGYSRLFPLHASEDEENGITGFSVYDSISEAQRKIDELRSHNYMLRFNYMFIIEAALEQPNKIWMDNEFMSNLQGIATV